MKLLLVNGPNLNTLGTRELTVAAAKLDDGSTGVRVDAQVVWLDPRPAAEMIPASARHELRCLRPWRVAAVRHPLHVTTSKAQGCRTALPWL